MAASLNAQVYIGDLIVSLGCSIKQTGTNTHARMADSDRYAWTIKERNHQTLADIQCLQGIYETSIHKE